MNAWNFLCQPFKDSTCICQNNDFKTLNSSKTQINYYLSTNLSHNLYCLLLIKSDQVHLSSEFKVMIFCFIGFIVLLCAYVLAFSTNLFIWLPSQPSRVSCCRTSRCFSTSKLVGRTGNSSSTLSTSSNSSSSTISPRILVI